MSALAGLSQGQRQILSNHAMAALQLPPPDQKWKRNDQPEELREIMDRFHSEGLVKIVGRDGNAHIWQTSVAAYKRAQERIDLDERPRFPCGHHGMRTVEPGTYTCLDDRCEQTYPRSLAEEVFADGV